MFVAPFFYKNFVDNEIFKNLIVNITAIDARCESTRGKSLGSPTPYGLTFNNNPSKNATANMMVKNKGNRKLPYNVI